MSEPESAGSMMRRSITGTFSPEEKGAFRTTSRVSPRHVEIARKLAQSEALDPLNQARMRLEALFLLDEESAFRHKLTREDLLRARGWYGTACALIDAFDLDVGGHFARAVPFSVETQDEIEGAFKGFVQGEVIDTILVNRNRLTPESTAKLINRFKRVIVPEILTLTARVADAVSLDEWQSAAGAISIVE
jgi:hypothetical protein